jgi:segregation and condensation protein B
MTLPGSLAQPGAPEVEAEAAAPPAPAEAETGHRDAAQDSPVPADAAPQWPAGEALRDAAGGSDGGLESAGSAGRGAEELGATGATGASEEAGAAEAERADASRAVDDAPAEGAAEAEVLLGEQALEAGESEALEAAEPDDSAGEAGPGLGSEAGPTLEAALEAILLVVDEPVAEVTLAQVLERPTHEVSAALRGLAAEYTAAGRGFDLREVAGGWRFYTRADCAPMVERFVRDGQQTRLTQAALETLAVVAYRQPVSRARVAAVRGVNSDGVMRTLVARGLVEEAGTDPESQAVLYRTSSYFLERLGLRDLSELPELAPFLPDDVENLEETTK